MNERRLGELTEAGEIQSKISQVRMNLNLIGALVGVHLNLVVGVIPLLEQE